MTEIKINNVEYSMEVELNKTKSNVLFCFFPSTYIFRRMNFVQKFVERKRVSISVDTAATPAAATAGSLYVAYVCGKPGGATRSTELRKVENFRVPRRHLCPKFTQLDITSTRRMFGIIKLLFRERA